MNTLPVSVVIGPGPGWESTLADLRAQDASVELLASGRAAEAPEVTALSAPDSPGATFLAGVAAASRPLVAWAPAGSRMSSDRLSRQVAALAATGDAAAVCWTRPAAAPAHMRVTPALLFTGETARSSVMLGTEHARALGRPYPHADGLPLAMAAAVALTSSGAVTVLKAPLVQDAAVPCPATTALAVLGAALDVLAVAPPSSLQQQIMAALVAAAPRATRRWAEARERAHG